MIKLYKIIALLAIITLGWSDNAAADGKYASIVIDAGSGKVLESTNAQALRHPASITKVMTLYLTFKALRQGTLRINQALPVSDFAAAQAPSKLGLTPGSSIRVRDAILALVTQSANDAAVVLAESLGGTESSFATKMTAQARQLGMANTVYRNASGLPDDAQITTARDMAILARAIYFNFPDYYRLFSTASFSYSGRIYKNHNHLMQHYHGMDGIKTGYIRASGFNLIASAVRGKTRLIAVIFGGNTAKERDRAMAALLDGVFNKVARNGLGKTAALPPIAQSALISVSVPSAITGGAPTSQGDSAEESTDEDAPPAAIKTASTTESNPIPPLVIAAVTPPPSTITTSFPALPTATPTALSNSAKPKPVLHTSATIITPNTPDGIKLPAIKSAKTATESTDTNLGSTETAVKSGAWSVQLGEYRLRNSAEQTLKKALTRLPKNLATTHHQVLTIKNTKKSILYQPQLTGLDKSNAQKICHTLGHKFHCLPLAPTQAKHR
jgi:D-alanyl-D-alanine carboxypeptidase